MGLDANYTSQYPRYCRFVTLHDDTRHLVANTLHHTRDRCLISRRLMPMVPSNSIDNTAPSGPTILGDAIPLCIAHMRDCGELI